MKVTFVRHGATTAAGTPKLIGRTDLALSELGQRQALAVANRLADRPFTALWSSPLQRCRSTASAIGERIGHLPVLDPRLAEMDLGELDGLSISELPKGPGSFRDRWQKRPGTTRFPGGENLNEVAARMWELLNELYAQHPHGHVLLVSHMFAISGALTKVFQWKPAHFRTFAIDVASLTTVSFQHGGFRLLQLNDCAHLDDLGPSPTLTPPSLPPRSPTRAP
jgi:broad specificity phosphatase PhoE